MQDIPYDIWERISIFLPINEVKNLLCVNRALFNIAMNARYRTSTIGSLSQFETQRSLGRLVCATFSIPAKKADMIQYNYSSDVEVAARVRTLKFHPGDISKRLKEISEGESITEQTDSVPKTRRVDKTASARMKMPLAVDLRRPKTSTMDATLMSTSLPRIMMQLTHLRCLQVNISGMDHWYFRQYLQPFAKLFGLGWSTFCSSLQSLDLKVPIENLVAVLPEGTIDNLETLSLQISRGDLRTTDDVILATLLPFLQAHHHSLRSLTLDSMEQTNLSPLLSETFLPHLTCFKLVLPHIQRGDGDLSGMHRFFRKHRMHLISLRITIRTPLYNPFPDYSMLGEECFRVALPKLEHLSLYHTFSDTSNGSPVRNIVIGYIHQFTSSITSLKTSPSYFRLESVKWLVEGFLSSARLKLLHISVAEFCPELITVLAANLPNLETLIMKCLTIMPKGKIYDLQRKIEVPQVG